MKLKNEGLEKFDVQGIKERLTIENKYITNLWSRMPGMKISDSKDDAQSETSKKMKPVLAKGFETNRANTLEELYSKLNEIKGKRLHYKEKLIKKGLKNKVEKKKRKDERRLKKTLIKGNKQKTDLKTDIKPKISKPAKPVFNREGKMVFSKFDFAESPGEDARNKKEMKDPHKLLKKVEKQKEKLKQLEEKGETKKVSEIKEKQAWKTALLKSAGEKVRDDPTLLKKTLKKMKQRKQQSRKKWQAREMEVQKRMDDRQQKRQSNINEHKKKKKAKKIKQLVKRGRIIPGH